MTPPRHHWRSYGNGTLPTAVVAMDAPVAAFPSGRLVRALRRETDPLFRQAGIDRDA